MASAYNVTNVASSVTILRVQPRSILGLSSTSFSGQAGVLKRGLSIQSKRTNPLFDQAHQERTGHGIGMAVCAAYSAEAESTGENPEEEKRRLLVSKRLESTARYFRRLGSVGFWGQLVCSVVAAVILVFSIIVTGKASSPATTYLTSAGIAAGFLSTFWSYGYMRLSNRLRSAVSNPNKAPPRANVVENLKNGLVINVLGMGSTLIGLQATVGLLVAKALTSSYSPFIQGTPAGFSPVLALDVFLVQASANAILSHFIGILLTLELLRAITLQQPPPDNVIPKPV